MGSNVNIIIIVGRLMGFHLGCLKKLFGLTGNNWNYISFKYIVETLGLFLYCFGTKYSFGFHLILLSIICVHNIHIGIIKDS